MLVLATSINLVTVLIVLACVVAFLAILYFLRRL